MAAAWWYAAGDFDLDTALVRAAHPALDGDAVREGGLELLDGGCAPREGQRELDAVGSDGRHVGLDHVADGHARPVARACFAGRVLDIPSPALTVGPVETWKTDRVSIWHPGHHDNPFGLRLTTLMLHERIADSAVPMSLLALHPNVRFSFLRSGVGVCEAHMY